MAYRELSFKQYIHNYVMFKISSGEWVPGDSIPSEHQLANRFNCSRLTARSALVELVAKGLLSARKGSGYKVNFLNNDIIFNTMRSFYEIDRSQTISLGKDFDMRFFRSWGKHFSEILNVNEVIQSDEIYKFKKEYQRDDELIAVKFSFLNTKQIREVYPEEINGSLSRFWAVQGIKINEKQEVVIFSKNKNLAPYLDTLGWDINKSYPIILSLIRDKNDWIEISFKIVNKNDFKFIRHYKLQD